MREDGLMRGLADGGDVPSSSAPSASGAATVPFGARADDLAGVEALLGVHFGDRALLAKALTHHSACGGSKVDSYDTLEFLGDALIGAYVVETIYRGYPGATEGEMTALKSEVVSRRVFGRIGRALGLEAFIRVDVASLRTFNERSRETLCADVLEALVGAIHIDVGREAAEAFVRTNILPVIPEVRATLGEENPKGALQQHVLRQTGLLPRYDVLTEAGTQNDRRYTVGVFAGDALLATGTAPSIKEAGREAARAALRGEQPDTAPSPVP